jgi:hypothetical protein
MLLKTSPKIHCIRYKTTLTKAIFVDDHGKDGRFVLLALSQKFGHVTGGGS